ncbi:hypothetical protein EYC59_00960 [Candidatus Saccharibacteria bacterium]|nr:MAG: hypothetical protein EYC59_00960 [Candidatus Saccharibacteria bacterium]
MLPDLEWYQIVAGVLFAVALGVNTPFVRLGKMLVAETKAMWRERENPDPFWAKVVQTLAVPGYYFMVAWVLVIAFSLGAQLLDWWHGTLLSCSVLTLLALGIWGTRRLQKHYDAKRQANK